jgi:hypothetical protein
MGLSQLGRSRTWLDDQGWWLGLVEFQPSTWSRGSYLNVGVRWLWNVNDSLSFNFGYRVEGTRFVEYQNDEQFAPEARKFAMAAAERAAEYRRAFSTITAAASALKSTVPRDLNGSLDAGVALGLVGEAKAAQAIFERYVQFFESGQEAEWRTDDDEVAYERARTLRDLAPTTNSFRDLIRGDVQAARALLKLDPCVELPF